LLTFIVYSMARRARHVATSTLIFLCLATGAPSPGGAESLFEIFGEREIALVVLGADGSEVAVYNGGMAEEAYPPFSTFKIWNALIALETGAAQGPNDRIDYDPEKYPLPYKGYPDIPAWKQPHDLASAFKVSAVWYFREMAERIGQQRMQDWLDRLDYGNRDLSGGVEGERLDDSWNGSTLRISAFAQAQLVAKLLRGETPFSADNIADLRDMAEIESCGGARLYGKTGLGRFEENWLGWLVGWIESGDERRAFALVMRGESFEGLLPERLALTKKALAALGLFGPC
jgi:beta-lactamase class D